MRRPHFLLKFSKQHFLLKFSKSRGPSPPCSPLATSTDSGKNAKLGGQTLFSMRFQTVCYKSPVNHLSVLDKCDTEDTTMFRVLQTKSRIPGGDVQIFDSPRAASVRPHLLSKSESISEASEYFRNFLMKLWWNALRSEVICMQCKQTCRYRSCSHVKSWNFFCCFIENVQVSCASFATVLVKELGHPICEYFDDQGPFWTHNKILTL